MRRTVEVKHEVWIEAPLPVVRSQFADLNHHIDANVHPKLRFEVLAQEPRRARYTQEVRLLGIRQKDLLERTIHDDGTMRDVSIQGFNKGATLDFRFRPQAQAGREGTCVDITIHLPAPPLMGWAAPLLRRQVLRETMAAAEEDKRDIERGYRPSAGFTIA